jgi:formamidopyrimidine-DNA glycosylase
MPELPEVETIRRGLERQLVGKKIERLRVRTPKIIKGSAGAFKRLVTGRRVKAVTRRGKLLALELAPGSKAYVLIHLKMTGQLIYVQGKKIVAGGHPTAQDKEEGVSDARLPNKHTHVVVELVGGGQLYFNDIRKFGYLRVVDEQGKNEAWSKLGVEPLENEWTADYVRKMVKKRAVSIKAVLLEQQRVAGLGNIYVDEVLWRARVRPTRKAKSLKSLEIKKITEQARVVLRQAIAVGGTTFSDYRTVEGKHGGFSKWLRVYDRAGQPCRNCRQGIVKVRLAGRGTHYCKKCQV